MIINETGVSMQTLSSILNKNIEQIQNNLGSDYTLRAEGVIDNIIVNLAILEYYLEQQAAYLIKQFDPKTADGEYQDALYERVGMYRYKAAPTTFSMHVTGEAETVITAGTLTIENLITKSFFYNNSDINFNENGSANIEFESVVEEPISVTETDTFEIVQKPDTVYSIDFSSISNIVIGKNRESDAEFRARFYSKLSKPAKCTRNAILTNLSEYTDGLEFITVHDYNSDNSITAGAIKIIAKPVISDEEFCKAILDNVIGGISFVGNTTVNVPLSNGQSWAVSYQKAQEIAIQLNISVRIRRGYYQNAVLAKIPDSILSYFETQKYGLNSVIRATEFVAPVCETEGVEAVTQISIKTSDDVLYSDIVELSEDEYPTLSVTNVHITASN